MCVGRTSPVARASPRLANTSAATATSEASNARPTRADLTFAEPSVDTGWALDSERAARPGGGGASTSEGRPYSIFKRALQRRNLPTAEAAARQLPRVNLADALELTILIARKEPRRHPRVAARWLLRYLEDCEGATIDEAALVAACLAALTGDRHQDAELSLRAMAERATSRRRSRGVA